MQRTHYYLDRTHPAVWCSGAVLACAAAARIFAFSRLPEVAVWRQIVWPLILLALLVITALTLGREQLYKTAIPIWLMGACTAWQLCAMYAGRVLPAVAACLGVGLLCTAFTLIIGGRGRKYALALLLVPVLAATICIHRRSILSALPTYLLILSALAILPGLKEHRDGKYHPTWGDRPDGRLIRSTPAIDRIGPYIMVNRTGANNLFSESVEISQLERYVHRKRKQGLPGFGISHVILAAYVRTVAKYPALNRFVAGQKVYSRGEDIAVSMTVKKELSLASPDTVIKAHFNPHDTAEDVYRKFSEQVRQAKTTPLDSDTDNTAGILTMIPGLVLKFVVWLLKALDYFGLVPGFLLEISPFHGSAYFTSMASLGIRPVYHHLYDFGTIPVFCAYGKKRRAWETVNGSSVERKYMDLKFNLDERICDGYYYASLIKHFLRILQNPEVLDEAPEVVQQDIP